METLETSDCVFGNSLNTSRHNSTARFFTQIEDTTYAGSLRQRMGTISHRTGGRTISHRGGGGGENNKPQGRGENNKPQGRGENNKPQGRGGGENNNHRGGGGGGGNNKRKTEINVLPGAKNHLTKIYQ